MMNTAEGVVPRTAARMRRVDLRVVVGILLMLLAIVGASVLVRKAQARVPVLVAARSVEQGSVIRPSDLRVEDISISGNVTYLPEDRRKEIVGKVAAERFWPGKLLSPASVADSADLPAGSVAMSLALKTDRAAGGELRSGDRVAVISSGEPDRAEATSTILFANVPVLAVRRAETAEGGGIIVTLRMRLEEARILAQARSQGPVDLVLLSGAAVEFGSGRVRKGIAWLHLCFHQPGRLALFVGPTCSADGCRPARRRPHRLPGTGPPYRASSSHSYARRP